MIAEAASYLERIDDLRRLVREAVHDLPADALNWRPIEGVEDHATNSLAVLATHIAGAEHFWITEVVGSAPASRDRKAEFLARAADAAEIESLLERTGEQSGDVLAQLGPEDMEDTRQVSGRIVPVRWCILHVIDHTALHLGQMQLTYQLWAGGEGIPSPRWFERLSSRREDL